MGGAVGDIAKGYVTYVGGAVAGIPGAIFGHKEGGNFIDNLAAPNQPNLLAPNALSSTPTNADASSVASRRILDQERAAASTSTILTGGQGLLEQPTTTSRTLMGN